MKKWRPFFIHLPKHKTLTRMTTAETTTNSLSPPKKRTSKVASWFSDQRETLASRAHPGRSWATTPRQETKAQEIKFQQV